MIQLVNKNYNLIGWQTEDIYQNLAITFISKIKTNQKIDKKIFKIPKMKMNQAIFVFNISDLKMTIPLDKQFFKAFTLKILIIQPEDAFKNSM